MSEQSGQNKIILVGVAGPSGAGKTTLVSKLREQHSNIEHIHLDNYLKPPHTFPKLGRYINWEAPQNIKFDLLREHLVALKAGKQVETVTFPDYLNNRPERNIILEPKQYVIAEGFLLLSSQEVRDLLDVKIYLDMPLEEVLPRRLQRLGVNDSEIVEYIKEYTNKIVVPQYRQNGISQKEIADYVVNANQPLDQGLKELTEILKLE